MEEEPDRMQEMNGRKKDCETLSPEHGTDNKAMIFLLLSAMDIY